MPDNNGAVTADYIAFHAAERPDALAIVNNGHPISYAELAQHILKFTRALRALGLAPGAQAAINCESRYFNWLRRLAFEPLRVITMVVELLDRPTSLAHVQQFDIVLTAKSFPAGSGTRVHATTTEWLEGVLATGVEDREPALEKRSDDPIRILLTSGTTGNSKKLLYTRRVHDTSIAKTQWFAGFTRDSRYLALTNTVAGPAACIRAGGTVVIEDRMSAGQAIVTHGITHTTLPPFSLKHVLDELPADYVKPAELKIFSFGAAVSRALRERALARLATDICDMYGSNEAGFVSSTSGTAEIGTIWPGTRVEVVDEHGRPLRYGEAGQIRVQTDYMVESYLEDPETTARVFRNGWFYAGDVGILHDAHRLEVLGRGDDVLNIGWTKIAPEVIEEMVLRAISAADVGVCTAANADGIEEICIAIAGARTADHELLARITEAFRGFQFGRFHIVKVDGIPRTANGKLRRQVLKGAVAEMIR